MTLNVVAVEEWQSDDGVTDLPGLLGDFEHASKAPPAQVAIGFTSQHVTDIGDKRIGVTRMALHDHILVREWRPASESGRTDVLLHEFGHYLGPAHSPEADSIMRPRSGDQPQALGNQKRRFDPVNALIMNLVAEEVFDHGVKRLGDVSPITRERLREVYEESSKQYQMTQPRAATYGYWMQSLACRPRHDPSESMLRLIAAGSVE